jgi:hypothetical protein
MAATIARASLHVEGPDDLNSIANLVKAHGFDYSRDRSVPEIKAIGGIDKLLDGIETAVELSTGRAVGFVLDADAPLADRWRSVRNRLGNAGVDAVPDSLPADGFVGASSRYKARVGVWLMPDNRSDGDLESFLLTLVRAGDPVLPHAEGATDRAKQLGAEFEEIHRRKAVIHAWLAWQSKPGCPYGTAITARFFAHDTETAGRFVNWYAAVFQLNSPTASK